LKKSGIIRTIAGNHNGVKGESNDPDDKNPLKLNLPEISSMDYHHGHLFVPTDLTPESGGLAVLKKGSSMKEQKRRLFKAFLAWYSNCE